MPRIRAKNYYAMTFAKGPAVLAENKDKIGEMMQEVHKKLGVAFADEYKAPEVAAEGVD